MNHETMRLLEQQFDTAFAAPDGIQKLRELILTLAMQGKLVPQDPNDQPASELLKSIKAEMQRLVKDGQIKQPKSLPKIQPDEIPCDLPKGWEWVRFGEITINRDGERIPVSKEERQKIIGEYDYYGASGVIDKVNNFLFDKDLLLIGEDGANLINRSTPIAFIAHGKYWVNNHAHVIDAVHFGLLLYLEKYINAIDLKPYVTGTAQPKMNQAKMNSIVIGLPPLAEQRRIVAKIDQLMARCDELEKLRSDRAQKLITVHTAAIAHLLTAQDSHDFNTAWHFIAQHFGALYSVKETVAELRKTILQLAVMGKLVPQDPNDEPASELLKAIELEKQRLVKEGRIKQLKPLSNLKPKDVPYLLPDNWAWIRLGEIVSLLGDGIHGTPIYDETGEYFFVNGNNLSDGIIEIKSNTKKVSREEYQKYKKELNSRTVMVSINGTIGNVAFYNNENVILGKSACYFNLFELIDKQYIKKILNSAYFLEYAVSSATGSTIKNVSLKSMREFPVPLPPLAEQHRIVAKVDQLMALCDRLEVAIATAQAKQTDLLNAVMAQV
jgi:type I restriction enzyme, S subunit